jgi:hypothetical protein
MGDLIYQNDLSHAIITAVATDKKRGSGIL